MKKLIALVLILFTTSCALTSADSGPDKQLPRYVTYTEHLQAVEAAANQAKAELQICRALNITLAQAEVPMRCLNVDLKHSDTSDKLSGKIFYVYGNNQVVSEKAVFKIDEFGQPQLQGDLMVFEIINKALEKKKKKRGPI